MPFDLAVEDVVRWAESYTGDPAHALLCDPPYHLTSIARRFGSPNSAPAQHGKDGAFARTSRGFMGQQWDGGDVAFRSETWAALASCMHPGAFGMAFGGSRGWHRLAVAIEDAGLIIHPTIFLWQYNSGFPKATRINDVRFEGHRYGGQAIKPAVEPIIVFQKPYAGRPIDNITATGAGALNIDGARIPSDDESRRLYGGSKGAGGIYGDSAKYDYEMDKGGRWPANFALDDEAAKRLDDSGGASRFFHVYDWNLEVQERLDRVDPVKYEPKASPNEREAGLSSFASQTVNDGRDTPIDNPYQRGETERRNIHPTVKPILLNEWLARLLLPPREYAPRRILVPFAGVGSEMIGAMRAGWEMGIGIEQSEEYAALARARLEYWRHIGVQQELF